MKQETISDWLIQIEKIISLINQEEKKVDRCLKATYLDEHYKAGNNLLGGAKYRLQDAQKFLQKYKDGDYHKIGHLYQRFKRIRTLEDLE